MKCDLCLSDSVEFLDLGRQPMANKYPKMDWSDAKEEFFDVKVHFCPNCKNIQLSPKVSRETMFVDYYYLSSVNKALVDHYADFAHTLGAAKFVVDIGSNDGISLRPLQKIGVLALGVEPSRNVSQIANDEGLETMCAFFNDESAKEIEAKYGKPDVITGLSMFSHLQDPHVFLEDVKHLLADDGKFIVEVEYNVKILEQMAFERFYLDRIFYFSATSFQKLFERHGMVLVDAEVTDIHGGSLRVTAKKKGEPNERTQLLLKTEEYSLQFATVEEFAEKAKSAVLSLKERLIDYKAMGLCVAGYGCPARTSTITNFGDIGPDLISYIVEDSPLKQNRYSPGKHIPIVPYSLDAEPDVWVVFAFEYFKEIKKKIGQTGARFLFPIPPREV